MPSPGNCALFVWLHLLCHTTSYADIGCTGFPGELRRQRKPIQAVDIKLVLTQKTNITQHSIFSLQFIVQCTI